MKSVLTTIAPRVYTKEEISALYITGLFDYYVNYTEFNSGENLYNSFFFLKKIDFMSMHSFFHRTYYENMFYKLYKFVLLYKK